MMKTILALCVASLCFVAIATPFSLPVRADTLATPRAPATAAPLDPEAARVTPDPVVTNTGRKEAQDGLGLYFLGILDGWPRAMPEVETVDYSDLALTITHVATTPEDGVLLAGVGYFEGARFAAYVDDGRCNDPKWRRSKEAAIMHHGDCDHGRAYSIWQIWPVEDPFSPLYALCSKASITSSRDRAAACALEKMHRSLRATGTLASYTGEVGPMHPKADERWNFVQRALRSHPFLANGAGTL